MPSKKQKALYTPPPGYVDFPFTWAFDGSTLSAIPLDGNSFNNFVYILGGWGDFVMRRIVGLSTVLDTVGGFGTYLIRDSQKRPLMSDPESVGTGLSQDDLMLPNEIIYPETSNIGFDLFGILLASAIVTVEPQTFIYQSQIAFQGVRRLPTAAPPIDDSCDWDERTFTYVQEGVINTVGPIFPAKLPLNPDLILVQTITDYDFDLYQVMIEYPDNNPGDVVAAVNIYDFAKNRISNIPILDKYYNGAPGSQYRNGAIVPPLHYNQNTQIRIDFFSLSPTAPVTVKVQFIGRQKYPRGIR